MLYKSNIYENQLTPLTVTQGMCFCLCFFFVPKFQYILRADFPSRTNERGKFTHSTTFSFSNKQSTFCSKDKSLCPRRKYCMIQI